VERFLLAVNEVEEKLIRHLLSPLLWFVLASTFFLEFSISKLWKAPLIGDDPSGARVLVREIAVFEGALLTIGVLVIVWEYWLRLRNKRKQAKAKYVEEAIALWVVSIAILFLSAGLVMAWLSAIDFRHILTILQRGLFVLLTVTTVPTLFLLINPKLKAGLTPLLAAIFALMFYAGFELLVTFLSSRGDESAFFARLNDVYIWNQNFPELARSELWLTIYMPWFLWYLAMYLLLNFFLVFLLFLRMKFINGRQR